MKRSFRLLVPLLLLSLLVTSCASTGPKVTREELKRKEEEFNAKFLEASEKWSPRIYRVAYRLVSAPVPELETKEAKFGFVGVGVDELEDYARKSYQVDKKVKGVLVRGIFPGSKTEGIDIHPGDVIKKLDGKKTKSLGSFFKRVRRAKGSTLKALVWRKGNEFERELPVEKAYYNAQFFLAPTPDLEASSAFSKISVGIGAIRYCRNDDELAVIMGHELSHTTLKHSLKSMGIGLASSMFYAALAGLIDGVIGVGGVGATALKPVEEAQEAAISRRYEREADYHGLLHAFHAGFNVENGSRVFSRLATDTPGFSLLAYTFASHPKSSERFLRLEKIVEELKGKYPNRSWEARSPDWEIVIPVEGGETLEEALARLTEEKAVAQVTTSERDTASPASPGKVQASEYPAPRRS